MKVQHIWQLSPGPTKFIIRTQKGQLFKYEQALWSIYADSQEDAVRRINIPARPVAIRRADQDEVFCLIHNINNCQCPTRHC